MELRAILILSLAAVCFASPTKVSDDLVAAEGHNVHAYASAPAPRYGGGATITSFNRRGSYAQTGNLHKPSNYGSSYSAPRPIGPAPSYSAPAPVAAYGHAPPAYAPSPAHQRYAPAPRSYGPQRNAFSEHSQRVSHDANYDPAKDPVSQYSQYIPVFEYSPKSNTGNELSIYGYRK